eukprot:TRINITY_DN83664_c0_g1_i1.p2 TRINITY_DN83664_c0_g1~~TRINITY_DN83664_c0_g1_i1.p2  ORF type:complete len:124 (-),score=28.28 TRINITY_DN83664_c0_g1_i1:11-382(-)
MLLFIDQPKHIRIVRTMPDATGVMKRERVGQVPKQSFEVPAEVDAVLQPEEKVELEKTIDIYRQSQTLQRQSAALGFPETMRVVVEYLQTDASESERKIIVSAIMEAVRVIRKSAKQEAEQAA